MLTQQLKTVLLLAMSQCPGLSEEEGGIILRKQEDFLFVKISNQVSGTAQARCLYVANAQEVGNKIIPLLDSWVMYGSFHTHPTGYPASPSMLDLRALFRGFPINIIYAPGMKQLTSWRFLKTKESTNWECTQLHHLVRTNE